MTASHLHRSHLHWKKTGKGSLQEGFVGPRIYNLNSPPSLPLSHAPPSTSCSVSATVDVDCGMHVRKCLPARIVSVAGS